MKYKMRLKHVGETETWYEEYISETENWQDEAREMIARFNAGLRSGESAREIDGMRAMEKARTVSLKHNWEKSCLVTEIKNGQQYDSYKCKRCGVTGKRFGLGYSVIIDPKYKAEKYQLCRKK